MLLQLAANFQTILSTTLEASRTKSTLGYAGGILFWIAIWALVAHLVGNDLLLAGPVDTVQSFGQQLTSASFWQAVGTTTVRVILVGTCAAFCGIALGAAAYKWWIIQRILAPAMQVLKSAPVACVIVIVLVAWGSAGALIAVIVFVALPPFYVGTIDALRARPRSTEEVLRLEGVSPSTITAVCTAPALIPFYRTASKTAIALSWRAAITAELLSLPLHSMGAGIYASKLTLNSAELLVWTITVMLLSYACELVAASLWNLAESVFKRAAAEGGACSNSPGLARKCQRALSARAERRALPPSCATLKNVSLQYGSHRVLNDFSLSVAEGERVCLMAPTGTGKSTAIGVLLGQVKPDGGEVCRPALVGVVMQQPTLVESISAKDNIALAAAADVSCEQIARAIDELCPSDTTDKLASELSGGTRRLVEIIRALYSPGAAIILDEPFAGLDDETRRRACGFVSENLKNRPLLIASHNSEDAKLLNCEVIKL